MPREQLVQAITKAREHAKELLTLLESQGHPETGRSSSVYLALVSVQKQATKDVPQPTLVTELQQLVTLCEGRLASVRPLVEEALRIAGAKA